MRMLLGGVAAFSVSHTHGHPAPGPAQAPPTPEHDPLVRGAGWKRWITFPPFPMYGIAVCIVQMYPNSIGFRLH